MVRQMSKMVMTGDNLVWAVCFDFGSQYRANIGEYVANIGPNIANIEQIWDRYSQYMAINSQYLAIIGPI